MNSEYELENLVHVVHKMARIIEKVMIKTWELSISRDKDSRELVWRELDELSRTLEEMRKEVVHSTLMYVARVQPLGKDLLTAYVLINVAYDIYRISRYCREIARVDNLLIPTLTVADFGLRELFEKAVEAISCLVSDLIELKPANKECVEQVDTFVDGIYAEALKNILVTRSMPGYEALKLLIVRHIERIVDHAVYVERYLEELSE